jgi:hypothetical protein
VRAGDALPAGASPLTVPSLGRHANCEEETVMNRLMNGPCVRPPVDATTFDTRAGKGP